jgi:archaellum component FlaC
MNKQRRKQIADAVEQLQNLKTAIDDCASLIETVACDEREYYDNAPENMQDSEKYERASEVADELEEAQTEVAELCEALDDISGRLEECCD